MQTPLYNNLNLSATRTPYDSSLGTRVPSPTAADDSPTLTRGAPGTYNYSAATGNGTGISCDTVASVIRGGTAQTAREFELSTGALDTAHAGTGAATGRGGVAPSGASTGLVLQVVPFTHLGFPRAAAWARAALGTWT